MRSGDRSLRNQGFIVREKGNSRSGRSADLAPGLVERRMLGIVLDRLTDEPVTLPEGPRAVGKSTALHTLAEHLHGELI